MDLHETFYGDSKCKPYSFSRVSDLLVIAILWNWWSLTTLRRGPRYCSDFFWCLLEHFFFFQRALTGWEKKRFVQSFRMTPACFLGWCCRAVKTIRYFWTAASPRVFCTLKAALFFMSMKFNDLFYYLGSSSAIFKAVNAEGELRGIRTDMQRPVPSRYVFAITIYKLATS